MSLIDAAVKDDRIIDRFVFKTIGSDVIEVGAYLDAIRIEKVNDHQDSSLFRSHGVDSDDVKLDRPFRKVGRVHQLAQAPGLSKGFAIDDKYYGAILVKVKRTRFSGPVNALPLPDQGVFALSIRFIAGGAGKDANKNEQRKEGEVGAYSHICLRCDEMGVHAVEESNITTQYGAVKHYLGGAAHSPRGKARPGVCNYVVFVEGLLAPGILG
mgnify:CR=1 FL=1